MRHVIVTIAFLAFTPGVSFSHATLGANQDDCFSSFVLPEPDRIVAIGDIHGDLDKLRDALELANVWDNDREEWIGGTTVVVQVGDQVRSEILWALKRLRRHEETNGLLPFCF